MRSESGQAATEYVLALVLVMVVVVALGGLITFYRGAGERSRPMARTLREAPYTLGSLQGTTDVLMH